MIRVVDLNQKGGADVLAAPNEVCVRVYAGGELLHTVSPVHIVLISASTATTPSARTISGLTSASAIAGSFCNASRDSATMACASASRSAGGLPRKPFNVANAFTSEIIAYALGRSTGARRRLRSR